jgi:hypothetical protein
MQVGGGKSGPLEMRAREANAGMHRRAYNIVHCQQGPDTEPQPSERRWGEGYGEGGEGKMRSRLPALLGCPPLAAAAAVPAIQS